MYVFIYDQGKSAIETIEFCCRKERPTCLTIPFLAKKKKKCNLSIDVSQVTVGIYRSIFILFPVTWVEDVSPKPVVDLFQIYMSINIVVLNKMKWLFICVLLCHVQLVGISNRRCSDYPRYHVCVGPKCTCLGFIQVKFWLNTIWCQILTDHVEPLLFIGLGFNYSIIEPIILDTYT